MCPPPRDVRSVTRASGEKTMALCFRLQISPYVQQTASAIIVTATPIALDAMYTPFPSRNADEHGVTKRHGMTPTNSRDVPSHPRGVFAALLNRPGLPATGARSAMSFP